MRLKVLLPDHPEYRKAIIHTLEKGGTFLFVFTTLANSPCEKDYWFMERDDALEWADETLGVHPDQWTELPEPLPGQAAHLEYDEHGALL